MKQLKSYITKVHIPEYYGERTLEEFCDINSIDIDNISETQLQMYMNNVYGREHSHHALLNHINEMLKSHSGEALARKIIDILNCQAFNSGIHNIDNFVIAIYVNNESPIITKSITKDFILGDCKESEQIYKLLDYYGYYITSVDKKLNNLFEIVLEPKYTQEYNSKNGIYYHVTTKDKLPNILKRGLRPHVGKTRIQGGYRYFTDRLFLIPDSDNAYNDIKRIINDKGYTNNFVILKINGDLYSGHKNLLATFIDDYSFNKNDVYTYEYIPKEAITIIDINELK